MRCRRKLWAFNRTHILICLPPAHAIKSLICIQGVVRCPIISEAFCCKASCRSSGSIHETSPSSYVICHDRWHDYCPGVSVHPHVVIKKQALTLTGMLQKGLQMSRQPGAVQCVVQRQVTCLNLYVGGKCSGPSSHPGNTRPALRACVSSSPSHNASSSSSWMSFLACIISPCLCECAEVVPWPASSKHHPELQPVSCGAKDSGRPVACRSHCCIRAAVQCLLCGQQNLQCDEEVQEIP